MVLDISQKLTVMKIRYMFYHMAWCFGKGKGKKGH